MAKNELVPQSAESVNNNNSKPSDFPNVGGSGMGSKPGYNQLVSESTGEMSARDLEGEANGPSVWGKGGSAFPVMTNAGEGGGPSTSMGAKFGVDLVNGDISPNVSTERS